MPPRFSRVAIKCLNTKVDGMRFTPIIPPPSAAQAAVVLSKNLQVICVGTRVDASLEALTEYQKSPAMGPFGYSLIEDRYL